MGVLAWNIKSLQRIYKLRLRCLAANLLQIWSFSKNQWVTVVEAKNWSIYRQDKLHRFLSFFQNGQLKFAPKKITLAMRSVPFYVATLEVFTFHSVSFYVIQDPTTTST